MLISLMSIVVGFLAALLFSVASVAASRLLVIRLVASYRLIKVVVFRVVRLLCLSLFWRRRRTVRILGVAVCGRRRIDRGWFLSARLNDSHVPYPLVIQAVEGGGSTRRIVSKHWREEIGKLARVRTTPRVFLCQNWI